MNTLRVAVQAHSAGRCAPALNAWYSVPKPRYMTVTLRRAIAIGVIIGEVCVAAYLSFMGWLLCVWMVDDSQAFRMQPSDWYLAAATRFIEVAAVATAFGLVAALLNCWVVRR